jgi:hypothetical protein
MDSWDEIDMTKLLKRGIAPILLMIFAGLIGMSTPSGFSLGDKLFNLVGLPAWSNGQIGLYYPGMLALCLLVIGAIWVGRELGGKGLLVLIIACGLLLPKAVSLIEVIYYKAHSGIWAIDYDPHSSQIDYASETDNHTLAVSGQLALTNFGGGPVTFGIKVLDDTLPPGEVIFPKGIILNEEDGAKDSEQFTLEPGERRSIDVYTTSLTEANFQGASGELGGPDLVLFTGSGTRIVGRNR